jgi:hypothetical protein
MSGLSVDLGTASGPISPDALSISWASSGLARFFRQPVATCHKYPSLEPVAAAKRRLRSGSAIKVMRSMRTAFSHGLNQYVKPPAKPRWLAGGYAAAMDAISARLANLKALVATLSEGGRTQKSVAIDLDLAPSYLSQLLGGKKMGDDVARKIESLRRLPHGWMDQVHAAGGIGESPAVYSQSTRIDPETIAAALKLVRLSFENLDLEFDSEDDGRPLSFAYEYLDKRGERLVTPNNVIDFSKKLAARLKETQDDSALAGDTGSSRRGNRRVS